jgi:hypothetical protein
MTARVRSEWGQDHIVGAVGQQDVCLQSLSKLRWAAHKSMEGKRKHARNIGITRGETLTRNSESLTANSESH